MVAVIAEILCASPCPIASAARCVEALPLRAVPAPESSVAEDGAHPSVLRTSAALLSRHTTESGMQVSLYALPLAEVPADFFADPDGNWSFEGLTAAAGFSPDAGVAIGALKQAFNGHPDGAAVVTLNREDRPYIAIIECPIAYDFVDANLASRASAA